MANDAVFLRRGKDAEFTIFLEDEDGRPVPIEGHSLVKLGFPKDGGGVVELFAPVDAGQDEQQTITFSSVPDSGAYKLKFGTEITPSIPFGTTSAALQVILRALKQLSAVLVVGSEATLFTIDFPADDGKRNQPILIADDADNTLKTGATDVDLTIAVPQEGRAESGVKVEDDRCTELTVKVSEADVALMNLGVDQDIEPSVRIGAKDLNIAILRDILTVEDVAFPEST